MLRYDWSRADPLAKWAATLFLGTIGVGYLFGIWMVVTWVGLGPRHVAEVYAEAGVPEREHVQTLFQDRPITLEEVAEEEIHRVDRTLLIQDTHVHIPVYALIAAVLAAIALGVPLPKGILAPVITALYAGPMLDFTGMWLTKYTSPGFAWMTLAGGWLMALGYVAVAGSALWRMWVRPRRT